MLSRPVATEAAALLDGASLFLDFDGTLVDFVLDPSAAAVDQRLHTLLGALWERLDGRLAILSGRSLADLRGRRVGTLGDAEIETTTSVMTTATMLAATAICPRTPRNAPVPPVIA